MPVIPIGYCQFNLKFGGLACPTGAEITLGADINVSFSPAEFATSVGEKWVEELSGFFTDALVLESVLCKFGPNSTGASAEIAVGTGGESADACVPPGVSLLVQKRTAFGGRAGRGRLYHPGMSEGVVNASGVVGASALTSFQTAFDAFHASLLADAIGPVVLHDAGSPITDPTPILGFDVQPQVATQRRRNRR